jgi:cyclic nucleotide gated channel
VDICYFLWFRLMELVEEKFCSSCSRFSDEITNSTVFNFGIFTGALRSGVVDSRDFSEKFFYCF